MLYGISSLDQVIDCSLMSAIHYVNQCDTNGKLGSLANHLRAIKNEILDQ